MNKALAIWQQLDRAWEERTPMPSVRELQAACAISSISVVAYNLMLLEREGIIGREPGKARSIRLLRRFGE
jgi:SOS-response transcriptional repressor LexA